MSHNLGADMRMEATVYLKVLFLYSDYGKMGHDITEFGKWLVTI
jgi:hypothetical protein